MYESYETLEEYSSTSESDVSNHHLQHQLNSLSATLQDTSDNLDDVDKMMRVIHEPKAVKNSNARTVSRSHKTTDIHQLHQDIRNIASHQVLLEQELRHLQQRQLDHNIDSTDQLKVQQLEQQLHNMQRNLVEKERASAEQTTEAATSKISQKTLDNDAHLLQREAKEATSPTEIPVDWIEKCAKLELLLEQERGKEQEKEHGREQERLKLMEERSRLLREDEMMRLGEMLEELERKLLDEEELKRQKIEECEQLFMHCEQLSSANTELENRNLLLQTTLLMTEAENSNLQKKITKNDEEKLELTTQLSESSQQINKLAERCSEYDKMMFILQHQIRLIEEEKFQLTETKKQMKSSAEQKKSQEANMNLRQKSEIADIHAQIQAYQSDLREERVHVDSLKMENQDLKVLLTDLNHSMAKKAQDLESTMKSYAMLEDEIQQIRMNHLEIENNRWKHANLIKNFSKLKKSLKEIAGLLCGLCFAAFGKSLQIDFDSIPTDMLIRDIQMMLKHLKKGFQFSKKEAFSAVPDCEVPLSSGKREDTLRSLISTLLNQKKEPEIENLIQS